MSSTSVAVKKEIKSLPNLMTCSLDLHISKAVADYKWTGGKITRPLWDQILAFFEWTYDTSRSESQVRLFVNSETQEWAAWAFPQEKGTGMTSKELPEHANWERDRQRFKDSEGWYYYGTVHHHCSCGAFQSGTDEHNERDQDGLHITVGKIGSGRYDLHARLYQSKWSLELDLSDFWDIGPLIKGILPASMHKNVAEHQMCTPPAKDTEFPEEWKENYTVPPKPVIVSQPVTHIGGNGHTGSSSYTGSSRYFCDDKDRLPSDHAYDCRKAAEQLFKWCDEHPTEMTGYDDAKVLEFLETLESSKLLTEMCRLMWLHDISPGAFVDSAGTEALYRETEADAKKELEEARKEREKEKTDGNPLDGTGWEHLGGMGY